MIWYISKRPEASTTHILYSIVDVFWICTPANHEVEIPWSYGSSMFFFFQIQRLKCLNSKLLRNPRLALKRVFLGTQWGSWDHEHWMHIKKGIEVFNFCWYLISCDSSQKPSPKWWKCRVWHLDIWWKIVKAALGKCLCTANCSLWGGFRSGRQWNHIKWSRVLRTHVRFAALLIFVEKHYYPTIKIGYIRVDSHCIHRTTVRGARVSEPLWPSLRRRVDIQDQ